MRLSCLFLLFSQVALAGQVAGRTLYAGDKPPEKPIPVAKDVKACGPTQPDESILLGPGRALKNAVVFLMNPPKSGAPASPVPDLSLDQVGCRFLPRVQATRVGAKLVTVNSDPILHNVHGWLGKTQTAFNVAMPMKGMKRPFTLNQAGLIRARCDAGHTWMDAYVHVFDHPFFSVVREDGSFELEGVPPGTYTLAAWHEKLGTREAQVTVADKPVSQDFEFK